MQPNTSQVLVGARLEIVLPRCTHASPACPAVELVGPMQHAISSFSDVRSPYMAPWSHPSGLGSCGATLKETGLEYQSAADNPGCLTKLLWNVLDDSYVPSPVEFVVVCTNIRLVQEHGPLHWCLMNLAKTIQPEPRQGPVIDHREGIPVRHSCINWA